MWLSTDVDDFGAVLREATRVLQPGGLLMFYGVHPCFNGPCIQLRDDGARIVHPTYREARWHDAAPCFAPDGIRRRTGMRHVPLADLLNAFINAGLTIDRVAEPEGVTGIVEFEWRPSLMLGRGADRIGVAGGAWVGVSAEGGDELVHLLVALDSAE
jgi:hypothetical protein